METEKNLAKTNLVGDSNKVVNEKANSLPAVDVVPINTLIGESNGVIKKIEHTLPIEPHSIRDVPSKIVESLIGSSVGVIKDDKSLIIDNSSSEKPLDVVNIEDAKSKVSDLVVFGNGDAWELLCKASSKEQGWMKSTKVMEIGKKGIMMQVTTEFRVNGVVTSCAEAIQFLEGVRIQRNGNGKIEKLY